MSPNQHGPDRRTFLRRGGVAAAGLVWPGTLTRLHERLGRLRGPADREFWEVVRESFLIPADRIYLNVGTLGVQPRVVVDAVVEHTRRVAETFPPGVDWDALKRRLGRLLNGDPAGFVFPRNTTEGMNFVANGLELGSGDEVLTTDHEHIGGLCPWQLIAGRHGVGLRIFSLPVPATDPAEILDRMERAITPRTKVVSISQVTFTTGLVMPVAEIARRNRERGIITVVDGAHPPGLMPVDLAALGADFYASSPHKWLLAPQGTGFLWMREEWATKLWPTLASGGWDDTSLGAHRFNHLGTFDESRLAGLDASLRFLDAIGAARIFARIRELRGRLFDRIGALPGVRIVSSRDDSLGAGMVSFSVDGIESLELQRRLGRVTFPDGRNGSVRTRVIGEYDYGWMRLSAHIYNLPEEIDLAAELLDRARTG
ncbi:MAG: aminotransferase class V-fold PLP-dependent enzyme [Gemmatimonadota bacterium]|jgi:isopenicillin-N epimerase